MSNGFEIFYKVLDAAILLVTLSSILIKPIRERIFGLKKIAKDKEIEQNSRRETDKCLLRNSILSVYYKYCECREIKQFDFENVDFMYKQYKALGGNSFVDKIWKEMQNWKVIQ